MGFVIKTLAGKFGPYIVGGLAVLLMASGVYLRWSGYNAGKTYAELECASDREAAKDSVLQQIIQKQEEDSELLKENLRINNEINQEVRKEDENTVERIETIIREKPVVITDGCRRDYSAVELRNALAGAGTGDSAGDSEARPSE